MKQKRKLRALVITMGGDRKEAIIKMFQHPAMQEDFEPPCFSPGVPSRDLRTRQTLFFHLYEAGLLHPDEYNALRERGLQNLTMQEAHSDVFFGCLSHLPISERKGSVHDRSMYFSQEFWLKAKGLNRGRATLACALAHLIALKRLVTEEFDLILEDNVRVPVDDCSARIRDFMDSQPAISSDCHFRYYGWLGSVPNLKWIFEHHIRVASFNARTGQTMETMVVPYGCDIENHLMNEATDSTPYAMDESDPKFLERRKPGGGSPVWGCYSYWMSEKAYNAVIDRLRSDVGALLWKPNRARHYHVKPIDKILPRIIQNDFGQEAVQISSHPGFFRAPMLTSKIHTKYDPAFCSSTSYQMSNCNLSWSDLWLTEHEKAVVAHFEESGQWRSSPSSYLSSGSTA